MHPDLEKLLALQQADSEIARLKDEIAALPRRVAAIEEKLAGTRAVLEKAKVGLAANAGDRRKQETHIQDAQQKISKYKEQSLAVKTNEQYKALMHEIEFAENEIRAAEDRILELMIAAEQHELAIRQAERELKEEIAEIEKEKSDARARTAEDEALLAEWNSKRDALRGQVSPENLRYYDRVLAVRRTALAEARDHKCAACHVMLRPQTYNEVRSGEKIVFCDSCDRLLYYVASAAPEEALRPARQRAAAGSLWLYLSDSSFGAIFVALVNADGSAHRYIYDADNGRLLEKQTQAEADYRSAWASVIRRGMKMQLDPQPEPDPEQLPPDLLADLLRQAHPENAEAPAQ